MKHGSPVSWANMRNKIEIHVKNDKSPKTNARRKRLTAIYDLNWKFGTRDYKLGTGNSRVGVDLTAHPESLENNLFLTL
jgi:hypothetical protein